MGWGQEREKGGVQAWEPQMARGTEKEGAAVRGRSRAVI